MLVWNAYKVAPQVSILLRTSIQKKKKHLHEFQLGEGIIIRVNVGAHY